MDEQELGSKLEPIFNSSVLIQDVAWNTCRERWTIEKNEERGSGKSVLVAWHDDDDIYMYIINFPPTHGAVILYNVVLMRVTRCKQTLHDTRLPFPL